VEPIKYFSRQSLRIPIVVRAASRIRLPLLLANHLIKLALTTKGTHSTSTARRSEWLSLTRTRCDVHEDCKLSKAQMHFRSSLLIELLCLDRLGSACCLLTGSSGADQILIQTITSDPNHRQSCISDTSAAAARKPPHHSSFDGKGQALDHHSPTYPPFTPPRPATSVLALREKK
jgi:hypothetical protein